MTQLASYGYSVVTQNVDLLVNNTTYNMNNIIAIKEGTANSNTPVIVSGHWDTVDDSPGMNDNASGCVAALDIARSLQVKALAMMFILFFMRLKKKVIMKTAQSHLLDLKRFIIH